MATMPAPEPAMINFFSEGAAAALSSMKETRKRKPKMRYRKKSFMNPSSFPPPAAMGIFNPQPADPLSDGSRMRRNWRRATPGDPIVHRHLCAFEEAATNPREYPDF